MEAHSIPDAWMCFSPLPQVLSVQMCDVVNEIEQERERCANTTSGNITSGHFLKYIFLHLAVWRVQAAAPRKWETVWVNT